jgi:hypothetical protein
MSAHSLHRMAGTALAIGSALTVAGYGLGSLHNGSPTPATVKSPVFLASSFLIFTGSVLVVLGLPGVIARQYSRAPRLTLAGAAGLGLITIVDGISGTFANLTLFPQLIDNPATRATATGSPPAIMGAFYLAATAAGLIGVIALGVGVLRARAFPRWTGIVLLTAVAAFPLPSALGNLPAILAGIAMTGIGVALAAGRPQGAEPAARSVTPTVA